MNGEYYHKGRAVFKNPTRTPNPAGGENISLGFRVCDIADGVSQDAAAEIARALNTPPETAEKAALFFDAIAGAKVHGKEWWAYSQMRQIEMHIAQDRKVATALEALKAAEKALAAEREIRGDEDSGYPVPVEPALVAARDAIAKIEVKP